ncbi:helix-turn-helix domain-containing protein [Flavobacteriaceae bacterium]|nr:helix-turn-helix domain-containing protein [Flavobacteriaceae bacterium]
MLNTDEIVHRIQTIIKENELSASSFADRIGVQRSSISHILSGRNKPSLDFLAKIEASFEEVSFSWLLKGEGNADVSSPTTPTPMETPTLVEKEIIPTPEQMVSVKNEELIKIVHYYADGSFEAYTKR